MCDGPNAVNTPTAMLCSERITAIIHISARRVDRLLERERVRATVQGDIGFVLLRGRSGFGFR